MGVRCGKLPSVDSRSHPILSTLTAAVERVRLVDVAAIDRPDTVAWVLLAQRALEFSAVELHKTATRLTRFQVPGGAVPVRVDVPDAFWPTAIAALAWSGVPAFEVRAAAAARFLIGTTGKHWEKNPQATGHDTAIVGWSWVAETHSWVAPTAQAMLALDRCEVPKLQRQDSDRRLVDGANMILDRQLPEGGWNYGNTIVFKNTLKPLAEETAWCLAALAGRCERADVKQSLNYLEGERDRLIAPVTLSAALLAWKAWNVPVDAGELANASLEAQGIAGDYPLAMVAQLLACSTSPELLIGKGAQT